MNEFAVLKLGSKCLAVGNNSISWEEQGDGYRSWLASPELTELYSLLPCQSHEINLTWKTIRAPWSYDWTYYLQEVKGWEVHPNPERMIKALGMDIEDVSKLAVILDEGTQCQC